MQIKDNLNRNFVLIVMIYLLSKLMEVVFYNKFSLYRYTLQLLLYDIKLQVKMVLRPFIFRLCTYHQCYHS